MNQLKLIVMNAIVLILISCGGNSSSGDTIAANLQTIAIDKIRAYAEDQTQLVPTIEDYEDAGVLGVTLENIDDVNSAIAYLTASDVDTTEKIQKIVNDLGINILPTADAGPDLNAQVNQIITITGSGSDSDGTIISYIWEKGDTLFASTVSFDYTPTAVGTDTLILTVMDDDGAIASDSINVVVTAASVQDTTAPVITVQGDNQVSVIQNTSYSDAGATAIDDRDGTVAVLTSGSVDITKVGSYTITYTVTDSAGNTATATRTVNVVLNGGTSDKKVFIIGDSTVYPDTNVAPGAFGWGSKMADYAANTGNIINRAVGGASSKSYIEKSGERCWEDTKSRILAADTSNGAYLLIQFGHNDAAINGADNMNSYQTLAGVGDTYYTYLKVYVDWAKAHGITPVLITPPLRRYYELPDSVGTHIITGVGTYEPIGDYPETMRILAATEGVILIDLTARTILEFEKYSYADLGIEFFIDNNHWHEAGAIKMAGFVVDEICTTDVGLCAQFNP